MLLRLGFTSRRSRRTVKLIAGSALAFGCFLLVQIVWKTEGLEKTVESKALEKLPDTGIVRAVQVKSENSEGGGKLKNWHNYKEIAVDKGRSGPGEGGAAYHLPPGDDMKKRREELYRSNGFNALVSDYIALNRSVRDIRHPGCKKKKYLAELPAASVILPFHNEHRSTLLRSVYSILERSPENLLTEVILADDFSNKDFLGPSLDQYVKDTWGGRVKVVRAKRREGLIRARLMGARAAVGKVLIFLDAHSECNTNWLPPLLEPIAKDYRTAVCPFVDVIDFETFEYRAQVTNAGVTN